MKIRMAVGAITLPACFTTHRWWQKPANPFRFCFTLAWPRATSTFFNGSLQLTGDASLKRELWKYHTENLPYQIGYGPGDIRQENNIGSIAETNGTIKQDVYDLYANYGKAFGEHAFKILAGYNQESYEWSPLLQEPRSSQHPYPISV